MLEQLSIKNIALIENLTLNLERGFNVLTGETGSGKSIIIDSLNLILGERADKELVRTGTNKARVEGVFSVENNNEVLEILDEYGIETEDSRLIISREISLDGKSMCRINSVTVPLSALKKIADKLADIHGQHEHQALLNRDNHLGFLDSFGGEELFVQRENTKLAYNYYKTCLDKLNGDWGTEEERNRRIEMLEFQINEIESAQIVVGQEEELKARAELLNNSDKIREALFETGNLTGGASLDDVRSALSSLGKISSADEVFEQLYSRLESVFYELEDISNELKSQADSVEADPYELERIEDRLALIKKLSRKYGADEEEILKYLDDANEELLRLRNAEETIRELERQAEQFKKEFYRQAEALSEIRHDVAIAFEDRIKDELSQLGMKNANLEVEFYTPEGISANGIDDVEFLFSANIGEPVKPLSKIISGGEMSRFMLAMKSIAADDAMVPTMVFDEIDTGISGNGALVVAQKIAGISQNHQVIAITHLPQIASMADSHFLIKKVSDFERTHTEVLLMNETERKKEIARLAGGNETALALSRAEEILLSAKNYKNSIS
ncbi:MAG: DNA repair protein RecN [Clostridia bacterium]|nr:DNA repair protein RecN [Clostridia bacterium]